MRHTAITNLLMRPDVSIETAKSIAGHITDKIIKNYSQIHMSAKKKALDSLMLHYRRPSGGGEEEPPNNPETLEKAETIAAKVQ